MGEYEDTRESANHNETPNRRSFFRKLLSVTALGVLGNVLLGDGVIRPVAADTNPTPPTGDIFYNNGSDGLGWENDFFADAVGSLHVPGDLITGSSAGTFTGGQVTTGRVNATKILATDSVGEAAGVIEGDDTSSYGTGVYGTSINGYGVQGLCSLGYAGVFGKGSSSAAGVEGAGSPGVSAGAYSAGSVALTIYNVNTNPTANLTEWHTNLGITDVVDPNGQLGVGTSAPARAIHLQGSNACFRMDRNANSAAFILVRTASDLKTIWKTFYVGVDASGVNNGSFFIGDVGTNVTGSSTKRLVIDNTGRVGIGTGSPTELLHVAGNVKASSFITGDINFANGVKATEEGKGLAFLNDAGEKIAVLDREGNIHIKGDVIKDL